MNPLAQTFGNRLAEQLAPRVLTPAFAFWAGGLLALWTSGHGHTWPTALAVLPTVAQVVLFAAAVFLIAGSASLAERLTLPVLRMLEGNWPRALAGPLRRRAIDRRARTEQLVQDLTAKAFRGEESAEDERQRASAEQRLLDLPVPATSAMPTRLGNILRAAEDRPRARHGLDPVFCWPHLWLLLDKETREELGQARKELDDSGRLWLWCLLFLVWVWWAWWAPLVTVIGCAGTYYGTLLSNARGYGQLLQATFDLYRHRLYTALNWPAPTDPATEPTTGRELTNYLWRGVVPAQRRNVTSTIDQTSSPEVLAE